MSEKKRGRPLKENAKRDQYRIRMTSKERDTLRWLAIQRDTNEADVIRDALKMLENLEKVRQNDL